MPVKLGVNIDHVATLRNARGISHPSVLRTAKIVEECGGDGITVHLREDRRHIKDKDVFDIKKHVRLPLNLECAATDEMLEVALEVLPNACCLVPEKRAELTTEGGIDVIKNFKSLKIFADEIKRKKIFPSFFIDADIEQLKAAKEAGAAIVEFHTGSYCSKKGKSRKQELEKIKQACREAEKLRIVCHAGHGLDFDNVPDIVKIPQIEELNIGHFIIGESLFLGLPEVIRRMRKLLG